jgi:hypothetical protein
MFRESNPKVIATYRPIAENIVSFIKLADKDPNNALDQSLRESGVEINNQNRAKYVWENWTYEIYDSLCFGLNNNRESIHIVHYKNLVDNPLNELYNIYDFLGVDRYEQHYLENIINTCSEQKDEIWGFKGLHDIRGSGSKDNNDPISVLGPELCDYFAVYDKFLKI